MFPSEEIKKIKKIHSKELEKKDEGESPPSNGEAKRKYPNDLWVGEIIYMQSSCGAKQLRGKIVDLSERSMLVDFSGTRRTFDYDPKIGFFERYSVF